MTPDERLERYARLAVEIAVNLQPGQFLRVSAEPEHLPLVRAIGRVAYERGARYVEAQFRDMHLRKARIQHAPEDSLDWSPPWTLAMVDHMIETRGATIAITGESEPELLADADQRRAQRTRARLASERLLDAENRRLIQWTIVGYPNEGWAEAVFGEPIRRFAAGRGDAEPIDGTRGKAFLCELRRGFSGTERRHCRVADATRKIDDAASECMARREDGVESGIGVEAGQAELWLSR